MNKRWICSDVWLDILPSFDDAQLGLKMALLSDRFDVLVDKHFDGKKEFTLWRFNKIDKGEGQKATLSVRIYDIWIDDDFVAFPLPEHPLPNKIRFCYLQIDYIDHSVITFLHANKQIWNRIGTSVELAVAYETEDSQRIWDVFAHKIWPVFATNIRSLDIPNANALDNLRRRTSPTLLTDLDQLISIESSGLLPDAIADDGPNATAGQALSKWLHTPTKNGQPKELHSHFVLMEQNNWFDNHKQAFLRATTSVNYEIQIYYYYLTTPIEPFELVNERTNEQLTLTNDGNGGGGRSCCLMKRCPIIVGETAAALQKDKNLDNLNFLCFRLYDDCIGPLSPPADQSDEKTFKTPGPSDRNE